MLRKTGLIFQIIIRTHVDSISILGRNTSGVKLINMAEDIMVASIAKVRETEKKSDELIEEITEEATESETTEE